MLRWRLLTHHSRHLRILHDSLKPLAGVLVLAAGQDGLLEVRGQAAHHKHVRERNLAPNLLTKKKNLSKMFGQIHEIMVHQKASFRRNFREMHRERCEQVVLCTSIVEGC